MFELNDIGVAGRYVFFCLLFVCSATVWADSDSDWLVARYKVISSDSEAFDQAYETGRERARLCSYCHGIDGNSIKDGVPNLAAQNPLYLWTQINHFASGERKNFVMQALAKGFSHEDKLNLAIYFSVNKVRAQKADSNRARKGGIFYSRHCAACHGDLADGNQKFARLAGQKQAYLEKTLRMFRMNANTPNSATEAVRRSKKMEAVARSLTDEEIVNLAAFLSSKS
ncbi:MAG TPA: c-type cytochrome [Gammaproteobacteria bacterium]|nr:c-type cytochrome [Gammaproteobacteria bacterium]